MKSKEESQKLSPLHNADFLCQSPFENCQGLTLKAKWKTEAHDHCHIIPLTGFTLHIWVFRRAAPFILDTIHGGYISKGGGLFCNYFEENTYMEPSILYLFYKC